MVSDCRVHRLHQELSTSLYMIRSQVGAVDESVASVIATCQEQRKRTNAVNRKKKTVYNKAEKIALSCSPG